jgi:fumarylacetoacetase
MPNTESFVPVPPGSDFTLANLPYGVCIHRASNPWIAVRLGDHVVDLSALQRAGCFTGPILSQKSKCFQQVRFGLLPHAMPCPSTFLCRFAVV